MPTIDSTTPSGVQPTGFGSGYTLSMSDEFNNATLDTKWNGRRDFGDATALTTYDINAASNSLLRMWWTGNTATDNMIFSSTGANPFRQRYGFFEAKVKCIAGKGFFPGFWLYPYSNSQQENPDGQQPELDIVEWFSYENGDWLVDTVNYRCKNAGFTIWTEGGGGSTTQAGNRVLSPNYDNTISTAFHTYGMRWTKADGLQWYYDGIATGSAIADPWAANDPTQLAVFLQLWWGPNGGNPTPTAAATPEGSSNALEWDYVRVWTIGDSPGTPNPTAPIANGRFRRHLRHSG